MSSGSSPLTGVNRAWRSGGAHLFFWLVVVLTAGSDLVSKWWAFQSLQSGEVVSILPGLLHFSPVNNPGAVFGVGSGKRWLFIGASVAAIIFILQLFSQSLPRQRLFHGLLGLILGGAIGNLYDRIRFGQVRDFIYVSIKIDARRELWPWVFNIADVALVIGVAGLLLGWLLGKFAVAGSCPIARPVGGPAGRDADRDSGVPCAQRPEHEG